MGENNNEGLPSTQTAATETRLSKKEKWEKKKKEKYGRKSFVSSAMLSSET